MLREIVEAKTETVGGLDGWEYEIVGANAKKASKEFEKMQQAIYDEYEENGESDDEIADAMEEETKADVIPYIEGKFKVKITQID